MSNGIARNATRCATRRNMCFDPESQYLRVRGASTLAPQGLAILRELTIWRDTAAQEEDVPPSTLLKDEILLEMSRNPIRAKEKFQRVRGLPRPSRSTTAMRSSPQPARAGTASGAVAATGSSRAFAERAFPRRISLGGGTGDLHRPGDRSGAGDQPRRDRRVRPQALTQRPHRRSSSHEGLAPRGTRTAPDRPAQRHGEVQSWLGSIRLARGTGMTPSNADGASHFQGYNVCAIRF